MHSLEYNELVEQVFKIYDQLKLLDVTIYITHRHYGKSIQRLSRQTGLAYDKVKERINYVDHQLTSSLPEYV